MLSFSNACFWHPCQDSDGYGCMGLFLGNVFHWSISLLFASTLQSLIKSPSMYNLWWGIATIQHCSFLLRVAVTIWNLSYFHMKF
jgi:predicted lysophospholipase L1 biosynthesis ABC-type transport system permease subunit